ncbi:hypothetical protein H0H93_008951 [Arthromyces matolae]|nr:hypothetical protein H0H93_008951 [Arthromyces matolae]
MWRWLHFMYRHIIYAYPTVSESNFDEVARAIEGVLAFVIRAPLDAAVPATEGLLGLCFAIYLRLGNNPLSIPSVAERLEIISDTLVNLFKSEKVDLKEIRSEIGSDKQLAAQALFRPAYMCIRGGPTFANSFSRVVNVHLQICDRLCQNFYGQFPPKTVMAYVCDGLSFVFTYSNSSTPLRIPSTLLRILVGFLNYYHLCASDGHAWLIYGLRNNLLSLLLQAANRVQGQDDPTTIPAVCDILRTLSTLSIHRPVLRHLRNVEGGADFDLIKDATLRSLGVALKEAIKWSQEAHIEFLEIRKDLKCSYDNASASLFDLLDRADVPMKCTNSNLGAPTRLCGGCKLALFCSKECQRNDWRRHRKKCGIYRPGLPSFLLP